MNPDDERAAFWRAVHTVDDRVTSLEAIVNTRNELMRDSIKEAVAEAMPKALISDDEHAFVRMLMEREAERSAFRKKIIDSSVAWAVPLLLGGVLWVVWTLLKEYMLAHGVWHALFAVFGQRGRGRDD